MALSPDDIVNHEFKQSLRGYAVAEVDDLLDRLADQVERTDREVDDLRQRLRESEARLGSALETESSIKRTLVTAQDAAERAMQDAREQADELRAACEREVTDQLDRAHQEAQQVVEEAQQRAATELDAARSERDVLEAKIDELRSIERRHRDQFRAYLQDQLAALDELGPVAAPLGAGSSTPVADDAGWPPSPEDGNVQDVDPVPVDPTDAPAPDRPAGHLTAAPSEGLAEWLDGLEEPEPAGARATSGAPAETDEGDVEDEEDEDEISDRWFTKPVDDVPGDGRDGTDGPHAP